MNIYCTLSGKSAYISTAFVGGTVLFVLNRRIMSTSVAATIKYSCFRRSSFPGGGDRMFYEGVMVCFMKE